MSSNQEAFEFYFLSNCYTSQVTERRVYSLLIEKVISGLSIPYREPINDFQKQIAREYGIEVPPTMVRDILLQLRRTSPEIQVKRDIFSLARIPDAIETHTKEHQANADRDSSLIFRAFNEYLTNSGVPQVSFAEFNELLKSYHDQLIENRTTGDQDIASLFFEWCGLVFSSEDAAGLKTALNKVVYTWFIYFYFHSIKRKNKTLRGFRLLLDTNVLVYLLGINGEQRKQYVEYLLQKAASNDCTVALLERTLTELDGLLENEPNAEVRVFNSSRREVRAQIKSNVRSYFLALFEGYGLPLSVQKYHSNTSERFLDKARSNLSGYKAREKAEPPSDRSVHHDVELLDFGGSFQKHNNLFESRSLIVSTDKHLAKFATDFGRELYDSGATPVLTLEKANFLFWVETDKAVDPKFLANTWLYVSESIHYFSNNRVDNLYRTFRSAYGQRISVPKDWRSPYLLIENELETLLREQSLDPDDVSIDDLVDRIEMTIDSDNQSLKRENDALREANERLKHQLNDDIGGTQSTQVVNVYNTPAAKTNLRELSLLELLKELFRRILNAFSGKKPNV